MTRALPYYYYRSPGQRQISIRGGAQSQSALLAGDEAAVLVIDFTDDAFAGSGHYGSAYIRDDSGAQILAGDESDVLALDFTDNQFVADTSQYGSAYIRTS